GTHALILPARRRDDDDVGPEALELIAYEFGRPLPDRDHRHDSRDADDDAEDGQERAQLVLIERAQRDENEVDEVHGKPWGEVLRIPGMGNSGAPRRLPLVYHEPCGRIHHLSCFSQFFWHDINRRTPAEPLVDFFVHRIFAEIRAMIRLPLVLA